MGFGLIIFRSSYKETFRRDPHNVNNLTKVAECSEVAPFKKTVVIFKIKSMMYLRRFRLPAYFDAPVGIKCHMN